MNLKMKGLLTALIALSASVSLNAQVYEITASGSGNNLFGDFTESELTNSGAGFSNSGSTASLQFNFYLPNNLGFGLRTSTTLYGVDTETYQTTIIDGLGITDNNYEFRNGFAYAYAAIGTEVGVSYLFDLTDKLQLEPYVYLGGKVMASPSTSVVYMEDGLTYKFEMKKELYGGFSYTPGLRLKWNIVKHIGLNFFVEYQGTTYGEGEVTSVKQSYNSLEIAETPKEYTINSIGGGLGLTYRFGKGLTE